MYNHKLSKPSSLPKKQRSFPKILPRIILNKNNQGRLNFPKKDDSSLFEGVGRKHYGFNNSTSLQKLMSPQIQMKIDDYRRKQPQKKYHLKLDSMRQKSQSNMSNPTNQKLYFSSNGKKQRLQTQLPQYNYNGLKTQQSTKIPTDRTKNLKILKTEVQNPLNHKQKINLQKRNSLLKNSHLRVIGGTQDVYKAMETEKKKHTNPTPHQIKNYKIQAPQKSQTKIQKVQPSQKLQKKIQRVQPSQKIQTKTQRLQSSQSSEIKTEKELPFHQKLNHQSQKQKISRVLNPTYNSVGILY